jgi:5-methylcytosine-specific restriction enzyme subunit McrC
VLDFLAGQLAVRMAERAAAGLHRGYREQAEQGPFLHGRLDLASQLREAPARKDQIHSQFEELTADVPCNRVPKATAEALLASPLVGARVKAALRLTLRGYEEVRSIPVRADEVTALRLDRLTEAYRPLLDLCPLLLAGLAPGDGAGRTPASAFLLDMERVWERYVTRGVVEAFAGQDSHAVQAQPVYRITEVGPGQPDVVMRPDVVVLHDGRARLVVDAKWKRLPRTAVVPADLYQMLAYCAGLGVGRAVLVYPGRRARRSAYSFPHAAARVEVRTVCVTGQPEACRRSLRRLGRRLACGDGFA